MYSFLKYFLQLPFPVFICYVQCFFKKARFNHSFFGTRCICWGNFGTLFINFEFVTLQSKHNSMKKETKILKY